MASTLFFFEFCFPLFPKLPFMEVPVGFFAKFWSFVSFLPSFLLLLSLGLLKAAVVSPIAVAIILVVNSSVIIGLWPAHFFWSHFCLARTKRLGPVLKVAVLVLLSLPLFLWPIFGIIGSLLDGVGYGFFVPLVATFEAVGDGISDKFYHCFADGCWFTIEGSCIVVMDFTDFCFYSYFSYMDELGELIDSDEKPMDVKLSKLPSCLLASMGRTVLGGSVCSICWSITVIGAVISAVISSFFLGLYAGVIVHQEDSFRMGLAYVLSVVSLFDEYVNDLLYLREGSCIPRPKYRRNMSTELKRENSRNDNNDQKSIRDGPYNHKLVSEQSRTLKWAIQQFKPVQVWDWLFKSCAVNGRILLRDGLITMGDIEECILKGNCKKLDIKLPAWCILQCLLSSAKSNSYGLIISDDMELTSANLPRDKMFQWFLGPLLIMKEQIRRLQLDKNEEICLRTLIMRCRNEKPEESDDFGFPSSDSVRRAQLQAIIRRLQGIVGAMSRIPSFLRRFTNLIKVLYVESIQTGTSGSNVGGIPRVRNGSKSSSNSGSRKEREETISRAETAPDILGAV